MADDSSPSGDTLDTIPLRALDLLRALGTNASIRATLAQRGYTAEEHALGWKLLLAASGYSAAPDASADVNDTTVRDAIAELDAWDEPHFRVIEAALARKFPEQRDYVFANLAPATGAGAVVSVATLLDRLDDLESSKARASTRKHDHAALELLAARGVTPGERARMHKLVTTAQGVAAVSATSATPSDDPTAAAKQKALRELYDWYRDWSSTAKSFVRRRDHLILLGLARRKKAARKGSSGGQTGGAPAGGASPST